MNDKEVSVQTAFQCWAQQKLPARVRSEQVAEILNCTVDDVTILIGAGLLKPLGKPAQNAPKYFSTIEVLQHASDRRWLDALTKTLSTYWKKKRDRRPDTTHAAVENPTAKPASAHRTQKGPSPKSSPAERWEGDKPAVNGQS